MSFFKIGDLTTRFPIIFDWSQFIILANYRKIKGYLDQAFPENLKGKTCLDIGCGVGGLYSYFKSRGADYVGIDINPRYLEYAKKKHGEHFHLAGACDIESLGRKFDLILVNDVFHHLSDQEAATTLEQASRILNQNGKYFVHDAIPAREEDRVGRFLQAQDATSERFRDLETLKQMFSKNFELKDLYQTRHWPSDFCVFILSQSSSLKAT
jgi:2-polyprenyl-3-methyl-5-hydroxy-6-metoxy-1,4-benzoquinol methylase